MFQGACPLLLFRACQSSFLKLMGSTFVKQLSVCLSVFVDIGGMETLTQLE